MLHDAAWTLAGNIFGTARPARALFPLESAMDDLGRAARDIAFAETADVIALHRITVLRDMIEACQAEIARNHDTKVALELAAAIDGLGEELSSFEETLPLERAFRADQRDHAVARIEAAQSRLRTFVETAGMQPDLFDPALTRDEAVELAMAALERSPAQIIAAARREAEARQAGAPIPMPEGSPFHFTQPEGWMAWLAARIAERVGRGMTGSPSQG
ncbi:hypothetical protein [Rhodobacter capsulatus]|jgi:hypothetical protein|uniref:Conserved domain protein n=1 Tax=Rhodobacter capsulatus (strain ATCC BAA-309 / NBRC 16581 / SB1003) TaxID=272942 RepID=D5AMW2_RHOCB|nr:hypothetical protein [Rhodobacter capsulatus]ADE84251.1 conserved domain protein [Rhodobacter capsulatus SB 1003]ETD03060.1 hypothetical protein U714_03290 [Rhodobacter capsulatus DE442]ETD79704.1 hypothetical protein U717_03300 [Rhodobacter capsulatus R121]ETD83655.1 hypothetical protein U703_09050 [Rhodobacter capsulatus YW1]ETD88458.1 hypothetical protein U713_13640 [Rhodobacter capsulatus YW2]